MGVAIRWVPFYAAPSVNSSDSEEKKRAEKSEEKDCVGAIGKFAGFLKKAREKQGVEVICKFWNQTTESKTLFHTQCNVGLIVFGHLGQNRLDPSRYNVSP